LIQLSGFSVKKQKERNTVKPTGKLLKLDEAVDDEDLQSTISAIVALEHSEAVSTVLNMCTSYYGSVWPFP
jgi:hypothetical protein